MTDKVFEYVRWAAYLAPDYNPGEDEKPTAYIAVYGDLSIKKQGGFGPPYCCYIF